MATLIAGPRAGVAKTVERGDAGAHQRGGLFRGEIGGDAGERLGTRDHVLGVATVGSDAGEGGGVWQAKKSPRRQESQ